MIDECMPCIQHFQKILTVFINWSKQGVVQSLIQSLHQPLYLTVFPFTQVIPICTGNFLHRYLQFCISSTQFCLILLLLFH